MTGSITNKADMDFSIIIPAKNEEKNIGTCLDSINAIDYSTDRYEVLVVDNGSTDRTVEIIKEKGAKVFVQLEQNISGLRNFGASQAKGKILVFIDADCSVANDWLAEASRYIEDSSLSCFGSPPVVPDDATWVQKTWFNVREKKYQVEDVEWLESMNMFVPRETFFSVGEFNEELVTCEDYDLSVRLQKNGRIITDKRIVAIHHGEAADLGHFYRKEVWRATSNYDRLVKRDFSFRELPSLLIPPVYCMLAALFLAYALVFGLLDGNNINGVAVSLLVIWQLPLAFLAVWKIRSRFDIATVVQLHILLNVYFFARGLAVCRRR